MAEDVPTSGQFVCWYRGPKSGVRCNAAPVFGSGFCLKHSGRTDGRAARKRALAAEAVRGRAEALLVEAGVEERVTILQNVRPVDPGVTLLEEVARSRAVITWLENRIGQMSEEELMHEPELLVIRERKRSTTPQGDSYGVKRTETRTTVSRYWVLLQEERKLLVNATTAALRSNIEERRVRLAERGVNALELAMIDALTRLGLDPQSDEVRTTVGAALQKALDGGGSGSFFLGGEVIEGESLAVEAQRTTVKGTEVPTQSVPPPPSVDF